MANKMQAFPTLKMGLALAVGRAPKPRRAIFAARQEPLPIWTEAKPVDTSLVFCADLQRRATASHPAGRWEAEAHELQGMLRPGTSSCSSGQLQLLSGANK